MRLYDWRYGARTVSGAENVAPGYFKVDTPVIYDGHRKFVVNIMILYRPSLATQAYI